MLTAQTQETINEEVRASTAPISAAACRCWSASIERRSRQPGANLYLIADPNGRILAGNVESLEPGVLDDEGWTEMPFSYQRYGEGADRARRRAPGGRRRRSETRHDAIALVLAPAQPDDRAGRPRPRRAGALPRRRAPRPDVARSA